MLKKVTRQCMRCKLDLTDAASIQCGIGPICNEKATQILAKEIPIAWDGESLGAVLFLDKTHWPEDVQPIFEEVWNKIVSARSFNMSAEEYLLKQKDLKEDWRIVVQQLAWLGSFVACKDTVREHLATIIRGLGYPQYANFMLKLASSSAGKLWLESGFVKFFGVNNAAGISELKKLRTNGARAEQELIEGKMEWVWRCPVNFVLPFVDAVKLFWPLTDCNSILEQIVALPAESPLLVTTNEQATVSVKDITYDKILVIAKPYNEGFKNAIKTLPYKTRSWDSFNNGWLVSKNEKHTVSDFIKRYYPGAIVRGLDSIR